MEESWTIKETAFNVEGISMDCFLPPADLKDQTRFSEACDLIASDKWYIGIWYAGIPLRTYVWVANRETPVGSSTALQFTDNGQLPGE